MIGIGHNRPPHQLETIELDGIPVTLYKRSDLVDPKWQMRIKVPESTKYVRQSTKCSDLEKAKEVAIERYWKIKLQIKNNIPVFNKTFSEICKELTRDIEDKVKRGDIATKTGTVQISNINRYYIPFFGTKPIASISQATVDDYWNWRMDYWKDKTPKAATLHHEANILNMVFEKAIKQGALQYHLKPDHKPPVKKVVGRRSELSREEYKKLARYMTNWMLKNKSRYVVYARARLRYMIKVAVNSGMRPPEMYNLTWADYSKQSEDGMEWTELRVHGKGKKHTIMCSIRVFNDLEHWKMDSFYTKPDDYVFAGWDGKRPDSLNNAFKDLLTQAGIPLSYQNEPRTLYSLRHTYATFQLRSGVDINDLSDNMDTGIDMIKKHYGHVKGADKARAVILGRKRF